MKLIIGNWKLNPESLSDAVKLASKVKRESPYKVVLCPPTVFLTSIDYPNRGAQDCFWNEKGAFTGQVSPSSLAKLGIKYVILGHSERRNLGETDQQINAKAYAALKYKITPVICVGHGTTVDLDDLEVVDIIKAQLDVAIQGLSPKKIIVAYEPVWALSSGDPYATKKVASPDHAERIALFIKRKYGNVPVIYGGSVNAANAKEFMSQHNIDGCLIGGASLKPAEFNKIIS